MMDGRVVGSLMTIVIILLPQNPHLQKLKPSPVLQHLHRHQAELVHKQQVVATQLQHQRVVAQLQMFITPHQAIVTIHLTVPITQLQLARQLVQDMVVILHQSSLILVTLH